MTVTAVVLAALLAVACAQDEPPTESSDWLMEGGDVYREGFVEYNGFADAQGVARFFYYSLNEGAISCVSISPLCWGVSSHCVCHQ